MEKEINLKQANFEGKDYKTCICPWCKIITFEELTADKRRCRNCKKELMK